MSLSNFIFWLKENHCELIPMPEWNRCSTLEIINLKNGKTHFLNTNMMFYGLRRLKEYVLGLELAYLQIIKINFLEFFTLQQLFKHTFCYCDTFRFSHINKLAVAVVE